MTDKLTVNLVVTFLGVFGLSVVAGAVYLSAASHAVPGELWTLAGASIGSLGSLLAKTSSGGTAEQPMQTQVVNTPAQPVPTTESHLGG